MKTVVLNSLKVILSDRLMTVLLLVLVIGCIVYSLYVGISLRPSDLQVAVHYTDFGDTTFYRQKWYYLITFIIYGVLIAVVHTAIAVKVYIQGHRQLALLFTGLSLLLVVAAFFITNALLRVAFL